MLISTIILGWIGVLLFLAIVSTFQRLIRNNEFAFLHILFAFIYALFLPLPITLNLMLQIEFLLVGTIFGMVYLLLLVITMTLQTGHIAYLVKYNDGQLITDNHGEYMMATLSNPFESFANVFKDIWALFLAIAFWSSGEFVMAVIMSVFSLFTFYYLFRLLD